MSKVSLRMQWGETHVRHGNTKNRMHINSIIALNLFLSFAISSGKKQRAETIHRIKIFWHCILDTLWTNSIGMFKVWLSLQQQFSLSGKNIEKKMYFKIFLFIQRSTKSSTMPKHKWSLNGSTAKPTTCSNTIGTKKNIIYGKYCAG